MTRKQKLMLAVGLAVLIPTALLATATYVIVDFRESGPNGGRVLAPVPLALIEAALYFTPQSATRFEHSELAEYQGLIATALDELRKVDEATLVSVESATETVLITKKGTDLAVSVSSPGETVRVHIPLAVVGKIVASYDGGSFRLSDAVSALRESPGELVYVLDGENEIRVSIW